MGVQRIRISKRSWVETNDNQKEVVLPHCIRAISRLWTNAVAKM